MTDPTEPDEPGRHQDVWQRVLSSAALDVIATEVHDWQVLPPADAGWLTTTEIPARWQRLPIAGDAEVPLRIVTLPADDTVQRWSACQALSAFRFTGMPSSTSLHANSDRALRTIGAVGIRTDPIVLPERPDLAAVRSSGRVAADGHGFWVRVTTYVQGSHNPRHGLAVEEIIAARADAYLRLGNDIGALSNSAREAFTARIGLTTGDLEQAATDHDEHLRAEADRGPVLSDEQRRFLWHALAVWGGAASWVALPVNALGYADWAAFDADVARMRERLDQPEPEFSAVEWTRILLLAEIGFASDLLGAGVEFGIVTPWRDAEALPVLRSIQRSLARTANASLLFPDAGRRLDDVH